MRLRVWRVPSKTRSRTSRTSRRRWMTPRRLRTTSQSSAQRRLMSSRRHRKPMQMPLKCLVRHSGPLKSSTGTQKQHFIQAKPAPNTNFQDGDYKGSTGEARGVLSIIEMLIEDITKEMKSQGQDE